MLLWVAGGCLLPFLLKRHKWLISLFIFFGFGFFIDESIEYEHTIEKLVYSSEVKYKKVVIAQGILESNFFQSQIFNENNNWLGLKCAKLRPTTCIGTNRGHAAYLSMDACLKDYILWQNMILENEIRKGRKLPKTDKEYVDLLVRYKYAEDKNYKRKILRILNHL